MTTQPLRPTIPGFTEGIVSVDPRVLQCQECGITDSSETLGIGPGKPSLVHILSTLRFHTHGWPDGRTDNPRLCRKCRLARGCDCTECRCERTGSYYR